MKKGLAFIFILYIILAAGCSNQTEQAAEDAPEEVTLTISSAASLTDAMQEIKQQYETDHPNVTLEFNFGGSGTLASQIQQGAPVDLFLSASQDTFEELVNENMIDTDHEADLLSNSLVLITQEDSDIQTFSDLTEAATVAIGTPETVPAGEYAVQTLTSLGLWEQVEAQIVYTKDVRQVLTYVESANAEAGIVYQTDAASSDTVKVADTAGSDTHDAIIYPAGVTNSSKNPEAAAAFYEYLQTDAANEIFTAYGFGTING